MSYEDGSGQIARRPRVNDGPPPVSGVVAIVLAVIAVVAGYLILRSITSDGSVATGPGAGVETPGGDSGSDTTEPITTNPVDSLAPVNTDPPGLDTDSTSIIVANANGKGGSAGAAGRVLSSSAGFVTVDATDLNDSTPKQDTSLIYYDADDPDAQTVANSLNTVLGGALNVQPLPDPVPVKATDLNGAGVLLMLGRDFADMTPADLDLTDIKLSSSGATPPTNPETSSTDAPTD
ncbi:MAG TPA: LytR C-terminal domain-containing protein [Ilumatobacter sp.]|nr:LytR C-terminal domain-containing protein [Ilumatobacter sp.]